MIHWVFFLHTPLFTLWANTSLCVFFLLLPSNWSLYLSIQSALRFTVVVIWQYINENELNRIRFGLKFSHFHSVNHMQTSVFHLTKLSCGDSNFTYFTINILHLYKSFITFIKGPLLCFASLFLALHAVSDWRHPQNTQKPCYSYPFLARGSLSEESWFKGQKC